MDGGGGAVGGAGGEGGGEGYDAGWVRRMRAVGRVVVCMG